MKLLVVLLTVVSILTPDQLESPFSNNYQEASLFESQQEVPLLGDDITVELPEYLGLGYDSGNSQFHGVLTIKTTGSIASNKRVRLSVPSNVEYTHKSHEEIKVMGYLAFGSAPYTDITSQQLHDYGGGVYSYLNAYVSKDDIMYSGTYRASIDVSVSIIE